MKNIFIILFSLLIMMMSNLPAETFKDEQQKYPRVRKARENKEAVVKSYFGEKNITYPPYKIFLRALKKERELELWAQNSANAKYKLIKTFRFTASSGKLGPKRYQGDLQIPEGFYFIDRFNPSSNFHLSFGINYPNKSDRIRKQKNDPGGDIFIHGNRVTIGCIPIGDDFIEELYIIAVDTKSNGQNKIPVFIFPCRMENHDNQYLMSLYSKNTPALKSFWEEIRKGYDYFESNLMLPKFNIDDKGQYIIK
ncbi:MAG: L,D-transpeptidase family protein, partial [candidate division Zixibacteria bacterium]|nr:L,D-transpeptidase family protein [candidate division Zixibacteria bacterium]